MAKKNLKYTAEKIDELLTKADEQMATKTDLAEKVDKVYRKGLSTNDYTTAEKNKLASIQEGAQRNTVTGVKGESESLYRTGAINITAENIGLGDANQRLTSLEDDVAEQSEEIAAVGAKVNTLQGTDSGKSVRTIAAEETAKIVGNAPANYDTLKEIADYIASDATGAAEMSNKINKNATDIANLDSSKLGKTEKAADSAKADVANNSILLDGKYGYQYGRNLLNEEVDIDTMPNGVYGGKLFNASHSLVEFPANADGYGAFLSVAYGKYGIQFIGRHDGYLYARVNDNAVRQWKQLAFTDSTVTNAEKLGGVAAADYIQKSGGTFTGNITAPNLTGGIRDTLPSSANNRALVYTAGTKVATAEPTADSVYVGSSPDRTVLSVPLKDGSATALNVTNLRLPYNAAFFSDIATCPNSNQNIWYRNVRNGVAGAWKRFVLEDHKAETWDIDVASATKLATPRTIWGQNFDGSGDVDGDMKVNGDVVIKGNVVIEGSVTSGASYQSNPLSTISEDEVPSVEQQLRSQISSLEERIAVLEQLIAQNNG